MAIGKALPPEKDYKRITSAKNIINFQKTLFDKTPI